MARSNAVSPEQPKDAEPPVTGVQVVVVDPEGSLSRALAALLPEVGLEVLARTDVDEVVKRSREAALVVARDALELGRLMDLLDAVCCPAVVIGPEPTGHPSEALHLAPPVEVTTIAETLEEVASREDDDRPHPAELVQRRTDRSVSLAPRRVEQVVAGLRRLRPGDRPGPVVPMLTRAMVDLGLAGWPIGAVGGARLLLDDADGVDETLCEVLHDIANEIERDLRSRRARPSLESGAMPVGETGERSASRRRDDDAGEEPEPAELRRVDVLVVEGDALQRTLVVAALEAEGWTLAAHESGRDALRDIGSHGLRPRLVVCGLHLPGVDGITMVRELRSGLLPDSVGIAMMSPHADDETVTTALRAGVDVHVTKPVAMRVLVARLHRLTARL